MIVTENIYKKYNYRYYTYHPNTRIQLSGKIQLTKQEARVYERELKENHVFLLFGEITVHRLIRDIASVLI